MVKHRIYHQIATSSKNRRTAVFLLSLVCCADKVQSTEQSLFYPVYSLHGGLYIMSHGGEQTSGLREGKTMHPSTTKSFLAKCKQIKKPISIKILYRVITETQSSTTSSNNIPSSSFPFLLLHIWSLYICSRLRMKYLSKLFS